MIGIRSTTVRNMIVCHGSAIHVDEIQARLARGLCEIGDADHVGVCDHAPPGIERRPGASKQRRIDDCPWRRRSESRRRRCRTRCHHDARCRSCLEQMSTCYDQTQSPRNKWKYSLSARISNQCRLESRHSPQHGVDSPHNREHALRKFNARTVEEPQSGRRVSAPRGGTAGFLMREARMCSK